MSRFRFKINLLEVVIFSGVLLIFLNSAYQLFQHDSHQESKFVHLMNTLKFGSSEPRELASQSFESISISDEGNCNETPFSKTVTADLVRLSGVLCGIENEIKKQNSVDSNNSEDKLYVSRFSLKNTTNATESEIFIEGNKFKTETINISPGLENKIQIEFVYSNGKKFQKDISLLSQPKN